MVIQHVMLSLLASPFLTCRTGAVVAIAACVLCRGLQHIYHVMLSLLASLFLTYRTGAVAVAA